MRSAFGGLVALAVLVGCAGKVTGEVTASGGTTTSTTGGYGNATTGGYGATMTGGGSSVSGGSGIAGAPADCSSATIIQPAHTLIADFECLPGASGQIFAWFPLNSWDDWQHGAYWYWNDTMDPSYQAWDCLPSAVGGLTGPGHNSAHAGHFETDVPKTSWGGGIGIWMAGSLQSNPVYSCIDASVFTGFSYWVKGVDTASSPQGQYTVQLSTFDTATAYPSVPYSCTTDASGQQVCTGQQAGGCTAAACDPYTFTPAPLTGEWTKVTIKWTDLAAPTTGVTAAFDPHKLVGINFALQAGTSAGSIDFWIDDVEWVGGGPSELPRTCQLGLGGAGGAGGSSGRQVASGAAPGLPLCKGP